MKPLGVLLVIITIITVANSYRRISCEGDVCSVCRESGCQLSCTGDDCESCPSGGCCNGINCNICVNSSCCQTQKCNYCVRKCNRRCPVNRIKSNSYCNDKCQKACVVRMYIKYSMVFLIISYSSRIILGNNRHTVHTM